VQGDVGPRPLVLGVPLALRRRRRQSDRQRGGSRNRGQEYSHLYRSLSAA
jgi:hypothetical protein